MSPLPKGGSLFTVRCWICRGRKRIRRRYTDGWGRAQTILLCPVCDSPDDEQFPVD